MKKQDLIIFIGMIILIGVFFLVYLVTSILSPSPEPEGSPAPSITPARSIRPFSPSTPAPSLSPTTLLPSLSPQDSKTRAIDSLPLVTPEFNIEYYYDGDIFKITIKQNPYSGNVTKAQQWFRDQGVNPLSLNIFWDVYPEVER